MWVGRLLFSTHFIAEEYKEDFTISIISGFGQGLFFPSHFPPPTSLSPCAAKTLLVFEQPGSYACLSTP